MKQTLSTVLSVATLLAFTAMPSISSAADSTVVVTGDTSSGENQPGWLFNRDQSTSTPFEFTTDEASIGQGSLYVLPIDQDMDSPSDKFIGEYFPDSLLVSNLESLSYDFLIGQGGDETDANEFYLNVYANVDDSNNYYDCRFDYVPTTGSTAEFTTASFTSDDTPVNVRKRGDRIENCPATLSGMPEGSYVRMFSLSVGDTSANDTGLDGYYDNVVLDTTDGTTIFDFEPTLTPTDKNDCKKGGWMEFNSPTFKNQGQCVSYVQTKNRPNR